MYVSDNIYRFDIGRFTVVVNARPAMDLDLSWDETGETREKIESGELVAFDAQAAVFLNGAKIAEDWLGGCIYESTADFVEGHRDPDPMNRNSSIMRAERGDNVAICHYFPDMVRTAVKQAREWIDQADLAA